MRLLRDCVLPMALGLILTPVVLAADDDKKSSDKKGGAHTVRGVVSEVTILGETDVDYATRKVVTAEATFVTVIGHAAHHQAAHEQAAADKDKKDTDAKAASNASPERRESRRRMNVYILAVSPRTKVCEVVAAAKGSPAKEEEAKFDDLEIGDRVEIAFQPKMATKEATHSNNDSKKLSQKHGRHRVFFGTAEAIKLLPEHMDGEQSADRERK